MRSFRIVALLLSTVFVSPCASVGRSPSSSPNDSAVRVGELSDRRIDEASGIAASRIYDDILWIVNDGGKGPDLFATDSTGNAVAHFLLENAVNKDWEDMASFVWEDRPYLLIADVGDNNARKATRDLYIVEEPDVRNSKSSGPAERIDCRRIRFVYEDGPRDCEAVAVDTRNMRVLLLTKREKIPAVYSLPLDVSGSDRTLTAERVGEIPNIPPPTAGDLLENPVYGAYSSHVTAIDIDSSDRFAVVLTYKRAYWFPKTDGETWERALSKHPLHIDFPKLAQAEAICFSRDGSRLFLTSEKRPSPLYRISIDNETFSAENSSKTTEPTETTERSERANGIQKSDL